MNKVEGNGHVEPCRDLKTLQKDVRELTTCVNDIKRKTVPWRVFLAFAGGLLTVAVVFVTWHIARQADLHEKVEEVRNELIDLKVEQARFNTKFNTIQEQVIQTLREAREKEGKLPNR